MSSSRALWCLPSVKKQKHDFFSLVECIIKQLLDSVFVTSRIIKVSVRITLTLIILGITTTSPITVFTLVWSRKLQCFLETFESTFFIHTDNQIHKKI